MSQNIAVVKIKLVSYKKVKMYFASDKKLKQKFQN